MKLVFVNGVLFQLEFVAYILEYITAVNEIIFRDMRLCDFHSGGSTRERLSTQDESKKMLCKCEKCIKYSVDCSRVYFFSHTICAHTHSDLQSSFEQLCPAQVILANVL